MRIARVSLVAIAAVLLVSLMRCSFLQAPVALPCTTAGDAVAITLVRADRAWTTIARVEAGRCYRLQAFGSWRDGGLKPCSANGLDPAGWSLLHGLLIAPYTPWFSLIGRVGGDGDPFPIGTDRVWTAPASGVLSACANDVPGFAFNNRGPLVLLIRPHPIPTVP
ncbi:MAG: hypothetical protein IPM68_16460 [Flavobacteriales bacterium]|nr:hypothetical protein [Flavobacteriales bacterium]